MIPYAAGLVQYWHVNFGTLLYLIRVPIKQCMIAWLAVLRDF